MNLMVVSESRRVLNDIIDCFLYERDYNIDFVSFSPNAPDKFSEFKPNVVILDANVIVPYTTLILSFHEFNPFSKVIVLREKESAADEIFAGVFYLDIDNVNKPYLLNFVNNIRLEAMKTDDSCTYCSIFEGKFEFRVYQDYYHIVLVKNLHFESALSDRIIQYCENFCHNKNIQYYTNDNKDIVLFFRKAYSKKSLKSVIVDIEKLFSPYSSLFIEKQGNYIIFLMENIIWTQLQAKYDEIIDFDIYSYFFSREVVNVDTIRKNIKSSNFIEIENLNNRIINAILMPNEQDAIDLLNELFFRIIKPNLDINAVSIYKKIMQTTCEFFKMIIDLDYNDQFTSGTTIYNDFEKYKKVILLLTAAINASKISAISRKGLQYIFENYQNNISLDTASIELSLSKEYLSHVIKKDTGYTFIELLMTLRMSISKLFLELTTLKVSEIAAKVGYTDSKYFIRIFRRYEKTSPEAFRKNKKELSNI